MINENDEIADCNSEVDTNEKPRVNEALEEDSTAFDEAADVRGLPFETSMINENPDVSNLVVSIAPGQTEKPRPLLSDPNFEELANPDKYPDGKFALAAERETDITPRRYFNQRLLDCDGRFAKSPEYLLSAQYATESKQVTSDINHFVFRQSG